MELKASTVKPFIVKHTTFSYDCFFIFLFDRKYCK